MSTLTVGRVSLTCDPERLSVQPGRRAGRRILSLQGSFSATSLDELKALRDELAATLEGDDPVPVTWDGDGSIDGFYQPQGGEVTVRTLLVTGSNYGLCNFRADLGWLGDDNSARFVSLITGAVLDNDHSYVGPGSGYLCPAGGRYAYNPAASSSVVRKAEDGNLGVFLDVASATNPEWHVSPANYWLSACEILTGGYLRAGLTCPNTPTVWVLQNGLVKVEPTTDGALIVSHYDGTDWRSTTWTVARFSPVGDWSAVHLLYNRPERCSIRLIRDRTSTQGALTLDLTLRRGSRILEGVFQSDASDSLTLDTNSAGTVTGTPTGTMKKDTVDGDGHRWMIGSEKTTTLNVANGYMTKITTRLPFLISKEVDEGGGVQAGDTDDDLWDQYMAWRSERVRLISP
jgi:hypothetical protein